MKDRGTLRGTATETVVRSASRALPATWQGTLQRSLERNRSSSQARLPTRSRSAALLRPSEDRAAAGFSKSRSAPPNPHKARLRPSAVPSTRSTNPERSMIPVNSLAMAFVALVAAEHALRRHLPDIAEVELLVAASAGRSSTRHSIVHKNELHGSWSSSLGDSPMHLTNVSPPDKPEVEPPDPAPQSGPPVRGRGTVIRRDALDLSGMLSSRHSRCQAGDFGGMNLFVLNAKRGADKANGRHGHRCDADPDENRTAIVADTVLQGPGESER